MQERAIEDKVSNMLMIQKLIKTHNFTDPWDGQLDIHV